MTQKSPHPFLDEVVHAMTESKYMLRYGPECTCLLMLVADRIDSVGCHKVEIWNSEVMAALNIGGKHTLMTYRKKCVDSGWLKYTGREELGRKNPGQYSIQLPKL